MNQAVLKKSPFWIAQFCCGILLISGVTAQDQPQTSNNESFTDSINVSNNTGNSLSPVIIAGTNGEAHLMWMDNTPGNFEIMYSKWDGKSWSVPSNVSNNASASMFPSVAVDKSGVLHAVWMDGKKESDFCVLYSRCEGFEWSQPQVISDEKGISQRPQIAVDSSDALHVVWFGNQGGAFGIYHTRSLNNSWTKPANTGLFEWYVTDDPEWSLASGVAAGSGNSIHLVWAGMVFGESPYASTENVKHSRWNGESWGKADVVSKMKGMKSHIFEPQVCVDKQDTVHVVWQDRGVIGYGTSRGDEWSDPVRISAERADSGLPVLAVSADGGIHFAWTETQFWQSQVFYRRLGNGEWSKPLTVSSKQKKAAHPTLTLDDAGVLHVAWMDRSSGKGEIMHCRLISEK